MAKNDQFRLVDLEKGRAQVMSECLDKKSCSPTSASTSRTT